MLSDPLVEDDQDRLKLVGVVINCVEKYTLALVHCWFYCMNYLLMHGYE